ncbi:Leucine aminopeptidase 1 [Rhizoclosmatium sp. JEL0117]|nr:Leucine aminopeptidase 1 [Rhizoclosmatium sp. JEL0117]
MKLGLPLAVLAATTVAAAGSRKGHQDVLVPQEETLGSGLTPFQLKEQGFRLISTSATKAPEWLTEADILGLYQSDTKFIDVTDGDLESVAGLTPPRRFAIPAKPVHQAVVNPLLAKISMTETKKWLTEFTSFKTRYFKSQSGKESAEWLYTQLKTLTAKADPSKLKITIQKFTHDWPQPSILLRIESSKPPSNQHLPTVILSAHQDSVNKNDPMNGRSPGADDDGSGSATIFETLRVLITSSFLPHNPLEFHWYSAEEGGLLGSQKVVSEYRRRDADVVGVFHADMTGFQAAGKEEVVAMAGDNVDDELQAFTRGLVEVYNPGVKIIGSSCGYGCSDHASWTNAGYPAAFTFENSFQETGGYAHSEEDTVEHITFEHVRKFTRTALAFAVELSYSK